MRSQITITGRLTLCLSSVMAALVGVGCLGGDASRWLAWAVEAAGLAAGAAGIVIAARSMSRVRHITTDLEGRIDQVVSASAQVSSASELLAQSASEQAASLEETSTTSQEITSTAESNANNSRSAASFMQEVVQAVETANQTLEEMVNSMIEINTASEKISKIIKVIDEIAFHTNILALNAAVEAARAGEAGMGFAVVANEVRNLSQRCAQAAHDTSDLIEESITKTNEGTSKMDAVTMAIGAISDTALKAKALVDEVNAASGEQARAMEQVARTIDEMQSMTQKTAANAEESASASTELSSQAGAMSSAIMLLGSLAGVEQLEGSPYPALHRT